MSSTFVGVGVGPGDPDLLTIRALRALESADRVFGPTMAIDAVGRAESIVRAGAPDLTVERLVFAIGRDDVARATAHAEAAIRIVECLDAGEEVAFITLGDPNVYSTFHHLASAVSSLRPGTEIRTVPGIMAFQDLAARTGIVVADGVERLVVVSAVDGPDVVERALRDSDATVVVYKGGRHLPAIRDHLAAADRLDGAVFGELLGLQGERAGAAKAYADQPAAYLATIIVPPVRRA